MPVETAPRTVSNSDAAGAATAESVRPGVSLVAVKASDTPASSTSDVTPVDFAPTSSSSSTAHTVGPQVSVGGGSSAEVAPTATPATATPATATPATATQPKSLVDLQRAYTLKLTLPEIQTGLAGVARERSDLLARIGNGEVLDASVAPGTGPAVTASGPSVKQSVSASERLGQLDVVDAALERAWERRWSRLGVSPAPTAITTGPESATTGRPVTDSVSEIRSAAPQFPATSTATPGTATPGTATPGTATPGTATPPDGAVGVSPESGAAGLGGVEPVGEAGSDGGLWVEKSDGWFEAQRAGSVVLDGDRGLVAEVGAGSRAVFDGSGSPRLVVSSDGTGHFRNLLGEWTTGGVDGEGVVVEKFSEPVSLEVAGGGSVVVESGDVVVGAGDGQPLVYRGKDESFVPAADGGWVRVQKLHPADFEAWLAAANSKLEAARSLHDIAARYRPEDPSVAPLDKLTDKQLGEMTLHGSVDDATAAVYESIKRFEGKFMRWTQVEAVGALMGHSRGQHGRR